jgi:hypothetical protein
MSKKLTLATVAALAAAGAFAAISLGGEGGNRPDDFNRSFERVGLQPVDVPSASASAGAQVAKGKPKAKYFESQPMPVTGQGADFSASCPRGHKALSGYFLSTGAIVPDTSAISENSPRAWVFGFVNLPQTEGQIIIGLVCGKKL